MTTMLARHLLLPLVVLVVLLAPVLVTINPEQVYQEVSLDQVCRAGAKVGNNHLLELQTINRLSSTITEIGSPAQL